MPDEKVEYAYNLVTADWFRDLFRGPVAAVWMNAEPYADLRKFGRDALDLGDGLPKKMGTINGEPAWLVSSLDGVNIFTVKGQPQHHFIVTMQDGTYRIFCKEHHVMLSGLECRYCSGDPSEPVTEFFVIPREILPPVLDEEIDRQEIWPISVFCGVSDAIQKKFEQLVRDHQKTCHRRFFGVDNRWAFMFEPTHAAPIAAWVKVSVRCKICGLEVVLLDEIDEDSPYSKYPRVGT